jgi:DNA-binding transcriptional MerR regulator
MARKRYILNEHAVALLRERYDSQTETIDQLSQLLGVPRYTVRRWAQVLGLARTKERPWSEKEIAYLESHFHRLHVSTLARKLKRTTTAVALKAKRLGIRKCGEGYTIRSLALALGVDDHKVSHWIDLGLLKATRRQTDRACDPYFIPEKAVQEFIVSHPLEIDLKRADGLWLIDLLAKGGG